MHDTADKEAITKQGLDPAIERLTAEGIGHYVTSVNGYCVPAGKEAVFVIVVPLSGTMRLVINWPWDARGWGVSLYADQEAQMECDDIDVCLWRADMEQMIQVVKAHLQPEETRRAVKISEATLNQGHNPHKSFAGSDLCNSFWSLIDNRDVPDWMREVVTFRYEADEIWELILLACTYPVRA